MTGLLDDLEAEANRWRAAIAQTGVDGEAKKMGLTKIKLCDRAVQEIKSTRAAFIEYACHTPKCAGGDGERCQCGYLDWYQLMSKEA